MATVDVSRYLVYRRFYFGTVLYRTDILYKTTPYHCMFNPIELIWAQIKSDIKRLNSNADQGMKKVEQITLDAISHVNIEQWRNCIKHTMKTEDEFRDKDRAQEHLFEQFVIDIMSDESSEGEFSDANAQ